MDEIELSSGVGLLARMASNTKSGPEEYQLELFDKNGHVFVGTLGQFSEEKGILVLRNDLDKLIFIRLSEIVHFSLSNASKHQELFKNQQSTCRQNLDNSFNVLDRLELLEGRLSTNYEVSTTFHIHENAESYIKSDNLASLVSAIEVNFSDLAKDDFARVELTKISQVVISHRQDDRLRFKMDDSVLSISLDLSESLGFKLSALVESGINKIL